MLNNYFKINEIAKLYNISTDTLRYYEKLGLISPERLDNDYRCYSVTELWKINIITDLRKLHVPIKDIQDYFENRNIETTKELFSKQIDLIDLQLQNLKKMKLSMSKSLKTINEYNTTPETTIFLKEFKKRKYIRLNDLNLSNLGIDIGFRILQSKSNETFRLIGNNNLCVNISVEKVAEDRINEFSSVITYDLDDTKTVRKENLDFYESVFYIIDDHSIKSDLHLEEGTYACISYKGPHILSKKYTKDLLEYAKENNLKFLCKPFEICLIDIHETINPEEFITQIQVRVK